MNAWNLDDGAVLQLRLLPETGLGFQWVAARMAGRRVQLLVFNCEWAVDLSEVQLEASRDPAVVLSNGWKVMEALQRVEIGRAASLAPTPAGFRLLGVRMGVPRGHAPFGVEAAQIAQPSGLTKKTQLDEPRRFHRYSAFFPDRRVDPATGGLVPGSFAVPDFEVGFYPTGLAAVGRLALPNLHPASNHYVLEAAAGTAVEFGTIAPAFGQAGGGVEAFFPSGAVNTRQHPPQRVTIPDA